ncbi:MULTISPECIES: phosphatase PAP2 family protein [Pseudonocardia]|uniref:Undecaprenyl pyrophosphate phosphatase n=2 Tax=Pseudonocardia TaxID=1847 RepID=A0A1Y2MKU4_PSEAH|nr:MULTISPECIES: phosphatase PAP2 family protein [Pseudonocardia]OSY35277.1 undecaprenyl pyrophosphate phosphatase [Pseudonocardia autotrophica]TDN73284.1 undecaprenyl-diphosphatase [Pseudonocardia autotrophica]BBG04020.1 hypothetical protein Pdca_52290 [Pseudonocardia autotrophica]GEC27728.1 hypothetical protein PSA01_47570 [Pseudonocardia saturnea]
MLPISDVPDASAAELTRILALLTGAPDRTGAVVALVGELALLLTVAVWMWLWWLGRGTGPATTAAVFAVPVATVLAWQLNELLKDALAVDRPCRLLTGFPEWGVCPDPGSWSFPSNHSAVAGALAVGVLLVALRLGARGVGLLALGCGLAVAGSRVLAGAHFPHDVVVGFGLGGMVAVVTLTLGVLLAGRLPAARRHAGRR